MARSKLPVEGTVRVMCCWSAWRSPFRCHLASLHTILFNRSVVYTVPKSGFSWIRVYLACVCSSAPAWISSLLTGSSGAVFAPSKPQLTTGAAAYTQSFPTIWFRACFVSCCMAYLIICPEFGLSLSRTTQCSMTMTSNSRAPPLAPQQPLDLRRRHRHRSRRRHLPRSRRRHLRRSRSPVPLRRCRPPCRPQTTRSPPLLRRRSWPSRHPARRETSLPSAGPRVLPWVAACVSYCLHQHHRAL